MCRGNNISFIVIMLLQMLNKKENKHCDSPDPEAHGCILTPNTIKRYDTINQEFDDMMKNVRPQQQISHHGAVSQLYSVTCISG